MKIFSSHNGETLSKEWSFFHDTLGINTNFAECISQPEVIWETLKRRLLDMILPVNLRLNLFLRLKALLDQVLSRIDCELIKIYSSRNNPQNA